MYLEEKGDLTADLDIVIWLLQNRTTRKVVFGSLEKQRTVDFKLMVNPKGVAEINTLNKVEKILILVFLNLLPTGLLSWERGGF